MTGPFSARRLRQGKGTRLVLDAEADAALTALGDIELELVTGDIVYPVTITRLENGQLVLDALVRPLVIRDEEFVIRRKR